MVRMQLTLTFMNMWCYVDIKMNMVVVSTSIKICCIDTKTDMVVIDMIVMLHQYQDKCWMSNGWPSYEYPDRVCQCFFCGKENNGECNN